MCKIIIAIVVIVIFVCALYYYQQYWYPSQPVDNTNAEQFEYFDQDVIADAFDGLSIVNHNLTNEYFNKGASANPQMTYTYPIFADTIPVEDVSPLDDMTNISDNYLEIKKQYTYDGARLTDIPDNYYLLDDGQSGEGALTSNLCSKSCCAPQWPLPFKMQDDAFVCANKDNLVSSNYACNSTFQNAGCMCLTKNQAMNITTRGGNAGRDVLTY